MIEVIYNEDGQPDEDSSVYVKIPKNVRQIGEIHSKKKIYIEDYVITYLNQLAGKDDNIPHAAVLLGEAKRSEGVQYIFVSGAVETDRIEIDHDGIQFTDEAWSDIYEKIKNYFDDFEIMGWMLIVPGMSFAVNGDIVKAHIRNFAGNNKIFMMMETSEKEESFYLFENGDLVRQSGYYIYFEKNPEMQSYMIYRNEKVCVEEEADKESEVIQNFRSIIQEKSEESHQKRIMTFMYAASTFLVMIVLAIGITMINNYDKMKNMEESLQVLSNSVSIDEKEESEAVKNKTGSGKSTIPVEDVPADIEREEQKTDDNVEKDKQTDDAEDVKAADANQKEYYVVAKGDTLLSISRTIYGDDSMVDKICETNQIGNGDKIFVGQKLMLP